LTPHILQSLELKKEMLEGRRVRLLLRNPKLKVGEYLKSVSLCEKSLIDSVYLMLNWLRQVLERYLGELDSLSPLSVLQRGYSITRLLPSYKIVKDNKMVSVGDKVNIVLGKGEIFCQVDKIKD
jgi:exodeoxyribonuclease VII large subunit